MPGPLAVEVPRAAGVREKGVKDRIDLGTKARVLDWSEDLYAAVEVPRHEVGAADPCRRPIRRLKRKDPAVLEEASQNAANRNPIAEPGDAGPQRADSARDQLDRHAGRRSRIQRLVISGSASALTLMRMRAASPP